MYSIIQFEDKDEEEWDRFVLHEAVNGTFLQSRKFLNYHPKERFRDASLMVYSDKMTLVAVCPACEDEDRGKRVFISHKGSTYGGIVVHQKCYCTEKLIGIVDALDRYLRERYDKIIYKITPDLFSSRESDLLQYTLRYCGYMQYDELSTYVDLNRTEEEIIKNIDRNKKRNIKQCETEGLTFRRLLHDQEVKDFHGLLTLNLRKFNVKPIHSLEDLLDFKNQRLCENVFFYGVYKGDKQVAGGMLFYFPKQKVLHAQNLSTDPGLTEYSAITYLYYSVILEAKRMGCSALSWGISTENHGADINFGLIRNKESYGSSYAINRTFYKEF